MLRRTAVVLVAMAALSSSAVASAEPGAPRPGTTCASDAGDAMTWSPGAEAPLVCAGGRWQEVASAYPVSDRWVSVGPSVELHGQGRRNPSMLSGAWIGTPSSPEARCHAEQVAVVPGTPTYGPPKIDDGDAGRPLSVDVVATMATIELSGDCLWQKVSP